MSVYVIAQGKIENREMLNEYVTQALETIRAHGGRVIAFDEKPDVVEGETNTPRTVIVEFEAKEAFRAWYDSPDYQKAIPLRRESAPGTLIVANGL